jgi:hypothetical protein
MNRLRVVIRIMSRTLPRFQAIDFARKVDGVEFMSVSHGKYVVVKRDQKPPPGWGMTVMENRLLKSI